jgi:arylsulfatase A-like enzyme
MSLNRRDFLKKGGAVVAGGMLAQLGIFEAAASAAAKIDRRPNILFILVDEMRFPSVFPAGVRTPEEFLQRFMPNLYELWRHGVKFDRYYSAGNACSPARATLATGLYPHQEWLLATRTAAGPALQPAFPTYGKLLRRFGYQTPYIGKWHLSNAPDPLTPDYLAEYGFNGLTSPDPTGTNGQGAAQDPNIAGQAIQWLQQNAGSDAPFCLTVSFVNPHDKQFLWAGSEGDTYEPLFAGKPYVPYVTGYMSVAGEDAPPSYGYPVLPPNWESLADLRAHGKPDTHTVMRSFQELIWGGAPDDQARTGFSTEPSPTAPTRLGVGVAPFSYWQRGLDMYTQVLTMVDGQIGRVIAAVPKSQLGNTVFVFASDHGEYAGAHGLLSGKIGTAYEEAIHVPLIVTDPSRRFARQPSVRRKQLASSVDLAPMLVTLGNRGDSSWRKGPLETIYGERLDLVGLLKDPRASGRDHVLFATDETLAPGALNYLNAPTHVLAVRTNRVKLVTYSHWVRGTTRPIRSTMKLEFYDYATAQGRAETQSTADDPRVKPLLAALLDRYVPTQMEAPLPPPLKRAVVKARAGYIAFVAALDAMTIQDVLDNPKQVIGLAGYGDNF